MLQWPVLMGIVCVVAITSIYFIWLRKPSAKQADHQPQQPKA